MTHSDRVMQVIADLKRIPPSEEQAKALMAANMLLDSLLSLRGVPEPPNWAKMIVKDGNGPVLPPDDAEPVE